MSPQAGEAKSSSGGRCGREHAGGQVTSSNAIGRSHMGQVCLRSSQA